MGPTHKDCYFSSDGFGLQQQPYIDALSKGGKYKSYLLKDQSAVDFLIDSIHKYGEQLAIIGIGPLTNLALAYLNDNTIC